MAFDPDAYLAKQSFNPDEYLASKGQVEPNQSTQPAPTQAEAPQERPQITGGRGIAGQRAQQTQFDERQALEQFRQIQAGQLSAADLPPEQVEAIRKARINSIPEIKGISDKVDFGSALAAMTAFDPEEFANIITEADPDVGKVYTPDGQIILHNNATGATINANKPGPSLLDAIQFGAGTAAFIPATVAAGPSLPALALGGMATQAGIETLQEQQGGEFNVGDVFIAGAAPVALSKGAQLAKSAISSLVPRQAARAATTSIAQQADDAARMALEPIDDVLPRRTLQTATSAEIPSPQNMALEPIEQAKPKTSWLSKFETPTKAHIREMIESGQADDTTAKYIVNGVGKIKTDPLFKQAEFQQFDQGTLAAVVGSSRKDKQQIGKMLDIIQKGMNNKRYASEFRPSDVIGDSIKGRVKAAVDINNEARSALRAEANKLRGKNVNIEDAVSQLLDDLDEIGVRVGKDFVAGYGDSSIRGNNSSKSAIADLLQELRRNVKSTDTTGLMGRRGASQLDATKADAYKIHRMKKFIDEDLADYFQTEIGTTKKSGGTADAIIKKFRHNIDTALDNNFDGYNAANTKASESIQALDNFKKAFGSDAKDITMENLDKYLGTKSKGLLANVNTRPRMLNSIKELEQFAGKYGIKFEDDILTQAMVVDELERRFGSFAPQGLQGNIEKAFDVSQTVGQKGIRGASIDKVVETIKNKRINEEKALRAFRALLTR